MLDRYQLRDLGTTLRRDAWAKGFLAFQLILYVPYFLPVLSDDQLVSYAEYYTGFFQLPAIILLLQGRLREIRNPRERRFWNLLSLAYAFWWTVAGLDAFIPGAWWGTRFEVTRDCIFLLFYLGIFLAIEARPDVEGDQAPGEVRTLEAAGVLILVSALLTYFVVIPINLNPAAYETWLPSLYLYVVLDLILAARFGRLAQIGRGVRWRVLYGLLSLTAMLWAVMDAMQGFISVEILNWGSGEKTDLLWDLPVVTLILAARLRHHPLPAAADDPAAAGSDTAAGKYRLESPLVLSAFLLPVIHFVLHGLGLFDPVTDATRNLVVLVSLLVIGAMAMAEHVLLRRRSSQWELESKKTAKEIEERTTYLNALIESSPLGVVVLDPQNRVRMCNPAFESLFGYSQEEVLDESLDELITMDEKLPEAEGITRQTQRGEPVHVVTRRYRKDRSPVDIEIHGVPLVIDGELEIVFGIYKDVTREVTLEEQLRQSQKLEAIGQLAGGIAHDFSNLLTGIRWHADFAARALAADDPIHRDLAEVQRAADSATSLTRQLLAFGRRQVLQPVDLVLNDVINDLEMMLCRTLGEHVDLEFDPDPDLGTVHVDPGQIEQVILNLCLNARDAMPANGGRITLRTRNLDLDEAFCALNPWAREGRFVVLSVADTGHGMDAETRSHIFEPFFTTKEKGTGTGLGLATVYGIVQQHEGLIDVASEPGAGSTFEIYLPLVEHRVDQLEELSPESIEGGGETILMAEDDEIVSRPVSRLLRDSGYEVLLARNGVEAVRLFEAHAERIALVFLDMVMPVMGGAAVREKILEIRPDTRFLLTTGYSVEIDGQTAPGPETPWLIKPYPPAILLKKVREILDA